MRWKIYKTHVCVPVTRGTYENKLNCKLFGRRVTFAYDPPSCHGSGSASSATWTWTRETEDTSSQPPCTQHWVCNQFIDNTTAASRSTDTLSISLNLTLSNTWIRQIAIREIWELTSHMLLWWIVLKSNPSDIRNRVNTNDPRHQQVAVKGNKSYSSLCVTTSTCYKMIYRQMESVHLRLEQLDIYIPISQSSFRTFSDYIIKEQ